MNYQIERGVSYIPGSNHPRHTLDIYRPDHSSEKRLPTLIYFHGGAWEFGDKESAINRFEHFFDTGYMMISVDYRLIGDATWPAQIDDVTAALQFIQAYVPGVDTDKIALWGSSAGSHLACLLAGGCRSSSAPKIQCLVNYCAPVTLNLFEDMLQGEEREHSPVIKLMGGEHVNTKKFAEEATVTNWVQPGYPPTLSVHGDQDNVVPIQQSEILTDTIQAFGSNAIFHKAKESEHRVDCDEVRTVVKEFLANYLKPD